MINEAQLLEMIGQQQRTRTEKADAPGQLSLPKMPQE